MGFHHVALASKDTAATHAFYTEVMGFELVKVVAAPTPNAKGWSKHFFYDTGGDGLIAFWELHDPKIGEDYHAGLAKPLGLPTWVNHLAFDAPTLDDLERHKLRWREHGITGAEVDHGFCISIYAHDPNGIMVEFCHSTREFDAADRAEAAERLLHPSPPLDPAYPVTLHEPIAAPAAV